MHFQKIGLVLLTLLYVTIFNPLTLTRAVALLGVSRVKAQNPKSQKIKSNSLLAEKIQHQNTTNIQVLKEAFEVRWMQSGSMEPTLHGTSNILEADWILVDKLVYRSQLPKRGDIIIFKPTKQLQNEQYKDPFIKRIIALPGEHVELRNGKVYINNKPLLEKYIAPTQHTSSDVCTSGQQPSFLSKPQTIPPLSYLVLGDNRNSSYDSRCWGVVPKNLIIGQVVRRFGPLHEREFDETRNSQQRSAEELFLKNISFIVGSNELNNAPDYSMSINSFQKHLVIAQKNKDVIHQIIALNNLIFDYLNIGEFSKVIHYSQQLLTLARENKIQGAELLALTELSFASIVNQSYNLSIDYSQQSLSIAQKTQDYNREYLALFALALANLGNDNCSKASAFYKQSLAVLPYADEPTKKIIEQKLLPLFPQIKIKACLSLAKF